MVTDLPNMVILTKKSYFYHTPTLRYTPIERATMSEIDVDLIFT